jgi:hypothetical protein
VARYFIGKGSKTEEKVKKEQDKLQKVCPSWINLPCDLKLAPSQLWVPRIGGLKERIFDGPFSDNHVKQYLEYVITEWMALFS